MVDVKELPDKIGAYNRKSKESNMWICGDGGRGVSICNTGILSVGGWRPVGFNAGKYKVNSNEEVIEFLTEYQPSNWGNMLKDKRRI